MARASTQPASNTQSLITGCVSGRIRRLKGFRKHHQVPDLQYEAAQDFVRKVGAEDVKLLADQIYNDIRETFGYKRKDFDYSCHEGLAEIKTPDFSSQVRIDQCPNDPKNYLLTTELTELHNAEIASNPSLHACFNNHCDVLCIDFPMGINVEQKIDAIEENEALAGCMSYEPDGSSFELQLPDLDLRIQVDSTTIRFQLLSLQNLSKLLKHSQRAFDILTECGFELRLRG
ncbi:MAG: hypothetical protein ACPGSB_05505 [Opitutales bacterium]